MAISGALAVTNQTIEGVFNTSSIDISLETFVINNTDEGTEEVEYANDKVLFLGDEIAFVPKIYNLGEKCYLRIKIDYIKSGVDFRDYTTGFSKKFEKHGEYYYYNRAVNKNEIIKIFDTIKVPDNIDKLITGNRIELCITAEAIQTNNFEPDYTDEDPWQGIVPLDNESSSFGIDIDDSEVIIKYENETEKDIIIPEDFMKDTKNMVPGDTFSEKITIENNSSKKSKYYMRIEIDEIEEKTAKLLETIKLKILKNNNVIYDGPFVSDNKIPLADLDANGTKDLEFEIEVPKELSNEYININPKFFIVFSASRGKKEEQPAEEKTNSDSDSTPDSTIIIAPESNKSIIISNDKKNTKKVISTPNTGDKIDIVLSIFLLSSICLIITMILDYIERKKENK